MLVVMVLQLNYDEVRNALHDAGYWFGAIIVLWAALYVLNIVDADNKSWRKDAHPVLVAL